MSKEQRLEGAKRQSWPLLAPLLTTRFVICCCAFLVDLTPERPRGLGSPRIISVALRKLHIFSSC